MTRLLEIIVALAIVFVLAVVVGIALPSHRHIERYVVVSSPARQIFDVVFFIVVVNSIIPGALIRPFTRWLDVSAPGRPAPQAVLEINAPRHLNGEIASYFVEPALVVCGARLSDIELPSEAAVMMIVRGQGLVAARGRSVLEAGDHVYVFFQPADRAAIELLFGQPSEGG